MGLPRPARWPVGGCQCPSRDHRLLVGVHPWRERFWSRSVGAGTGRLRSPGRLAARWAAASSAPARPACRRARSRRPRSKSGTTRSRTAIAFVRLERRRQARPRCRPPLYHIVVDPARASGSGRRAPAGTTERNVAAPGRQVGIGQPLAGQHRVSGCPAPSSRSLVRGQVVPMVPPPAWVRRRAVQALPGPYQQRDGSRRPTAGLPAICRRVATQDRRPEAGQTGRLWFRPGLEQRVRGRPGRPLPHAFRHGGPQRRLQHRG